MPMRAYLGEHIRICLEGRIPVKIRASVCRAAARMVSVSFDAGLLLVRRPPPPLTSAEHMHIHLI
jgi:hypothetical protein